NLVGAPGQGWTVAKAVLGHERALISKIRDATAAAEEPLEAIARRYLGGVPGQPLPDPALRDRIAQANIDLLCSRLLLRRTREAIEAGRAPGPESSLLKLVGTELSKRRRQIDRAIRSFQGLGWEGEGFSAEELASTRRWLRSRAMSIEGGTSEIQLNIIAKRVLGLPD